MTDKNNQTEDKELEANDVEITNQSNETVEQPIEEVTENIESVDEVAVLTKELNEYKDKYLRLSAEFDNYRKRTLREKIEHSKTAGKDLLQEFLPIVDDFERAIKAHQNDVEIDILKQGFELIYAKCVTLLAKNNVKEIDAVEKEFDLDLHEAITKIPAPDEKLKGKVIDVLQKGYMIDEKVLRFAKVVIGE